MENCAKILTTLFFLIVLSQHLEAQFLNGGPQPGDIYKEYYINLARNNTSWRVTDPNSTFVGDPNNSPSTFLPNPVHSFNIDDYSNVERVEIIMDVWGGHVGTTGKKIKFNNNAWVTVPELNTTPTDGQCYTQQVSYVIDVPVSHLASGNNTIQGTSGNQTCFSFNWGQWGWYGAVVRVYYNSNKGQTTGQITSHSSGDIFSDNPVIQVNPNGSVDRIDVVAKYDGYDVDGDGYFNEWAEDYHRRSWADPIGINSHVGTITTSPYSISWDTEWIPDQASGAVSLIARIKDNNGYWFVTDEVSNLTLQRNNYSVKLFKPNNVPRNFWVRNGQTKSSNVNIPNLNQATDAKIFVRTWNGREKDASYYTRVNGYTLPDYGRDHFFSYDNLDIPIGSLNSGSNTITFHSSTTHHGIEILWPGPAVIVKYGSAPQGNAPTITQQPLYQNKTEGQSATFSVSATGTSPLTYQWMVNGTPITGATQSTYSIPSVSINDDGDVYTCSVTNTFGSVLSNTAALSVIGSGVRITNDFDEGIDCYKIETPRAVYFFDKAGGGLVSMIDNDGVDWISHNASSGSAGEYRGFPNSGELHPGYTGGSSSTLNTLNIWYDNVTIESSRNGESMTWEFLPTYVKVTLNSIGGNDNAYWILFEGTPGGAVGADDMVYLSNGTSFSANDDNPFGDADITNTSGNATGSEWMYISDGTQNRSVYLAITDDNVRDNYWQMENNMTVFGYGRGQNSIVQYRTDVGAEMVLGFVESKVSSTVQNTIDAAWKGDNQSPVPQAPSNLLATDVSQGEVSLSWIDNSDNEEGFVIERQTNGGGYVELTTTLADVTSYSDVTVGPAISYDYRVRAVNGSGSSAATNVASLTISGSPSSLVLDLPFAGNANDGSNYDNDGILNGGVQLIADRLGNAGHAYNFDGSNDFIEVSHSPELSVDYVTLASWIYVDSYKDDQRIISKETGTVEPWSSYTLLLSGNNERYLQFRIGVEGKRQMVTSTSQIPLSQWVHVAATYDGTVMRLYVNGQLNNTTTQSGVIQDTPNALMVGTSEFWPRYFDGRIDEVRVYNDALSDAEILMLYNQVNTGPEAPAAPTGLTATEVSDTEIALSWTDASEDEDGFTIERQENDGGYAELITIGANVTSYSDTTVSPGNTYDYRLKAYNAEGESAASNVASVTIELPEVIPAAPTSLSATEVSKTEISLNWTDNSDNEEGFVIERQEDGSGFTQLFSTLADVTSYSDTSAIAGINYDYRVSAINALGPSTTSNVVTIYLVPPPAAPTSLAAEELSLTEIGLSWEDNSDNEDGFLIERQSNGGGYVALTTTTANITTYTDTSAISGINYDYRAFAFNSEDTSSASNIASIYILAPSAAPTELTASQISQTEIELSWTDNSDNEEGFIIERQEYGGGYSELITTSADVTSYSDRSAVAGIAYDYRVSAINAAGQSDTSNTASIYILPLPDAPSNLTATEVSQSEVSLSWTDNSNNEEGFVIERQINGGSYTELTTTLADVTSYSDVTVGPAISYDYRVRAVNGSGSSAATNVASLTISGSPSSLVLDLSFAGNANDGSNYDNDGILNGGVQLIADRLGNAGHAYNFDGSNDYIEVAHSPELSVDYVTLSSWIYVDSYKDDQRIISKETGTIEPWSSYTLLLSGNNERYLQFRIGVGGTRHMVTSTSQIPLGQWVHVAATYDGTVMRLYVNGQLNNTTTHSGVIQDTPNALMIGTSEFWPRYFDGRIDEVRVYNDALSDAEILMLYNQVNTGPEAPAAPTGLTATEVSDTEIALSWTDASEDEDGFTIERQENGGGYAELITTAANVTSYSDTTVSPGNTYDYRLKAYNAEGESAASNVASVTIDLPEVLPAAPTSLSATEVSKTEISLSWIDNSDNEEGFVIERQEDGGSFAALFTTLADVTSYSDTSAIAGINYDYRVSAVNALGSSPTSNVISIYLVPPPATPTSLAAEELSLTEIGLIWVDNSDNEDGFLIERQSNGGGYIALTTTTANITTYTDTSAIQGINYDYRAFAFNSEDTSSASNIASIYILAPSAAPTELTASQISQTKIELSWTDNSDNEEGFIIERQEYGGGYSELITTSADVTSYSDQSAVAGIAYDYRVSAINAAGQSDTSNTASIYILPLPEAPSNLTATEVSQSEVSLSWADNSNNEEGFVIERQTNGGGYVELTTTLADVTSYSDVTVGPAISYDYRVRAVNGSGTSAASNIASLTISGSPSSLVLDLSFAGNANDGSSYGNNGVVNGGVQLVADRLGNAGHAYNFDGSNDYIEVPHSPELSVDYVTLSSWIYVDSYKDDQRIISKETGTVEPWSSYTLLLSGNNERYLQFRIGVGGKRYMVTSTSQIPLGQWVHVAASYDGTVMRLYVNGQLNNTTTQSGVIQDTPNALMVGTSEFWPRYFDGRIDEVRVYNEALSDAEILMLYNQVNTGPEAPAAPTGLTATEVSDTEIALSWTDSSEDEDGFTIERQENGGGYAELITIGANVTSYSDTTVSPGNTYDYRLKAYNAEGESPESNVASVTIEQETNSPIVDVWYGDSQSFGQIGNPQYWVNILGNVSDNDGSIDSLSYNLNGGNYIKLNIGPDERRLHNNGDFNIDVFVYDLIDGNNSINVFAEDNDGNITIKEITLNYSSGNYWNQNYSIDWGGVSDIQNVAQVVDGKWELTNDGVRTTETGYDRLIAIGDISWTNYEVTVPITVHSLDSTIGPLGGNEYGVGLLMRWKGHTDEPASGWSPKSGWEPYGEIGWMNWNKNTGTNPRVSFLKSDTLDFRSIQFNQPYMFKFQTETLAGGSHAYRLKVWLASGQEPSEWNLIHLADSTELERGSFMLIAHHVDATFGNINVTPINPDLPFAPSELMATEVSKSTIQLTWTDNSINEEEFIIERQENNSGYSLLTITEENVVSYEDTTVSVGNSYDYRLFASNATGESDTSNTASLTIEIPVLPSAPLLLTAREVSPSEIELNWTDNSDNEDGFILFREVNNYGLMLLDTISSNETSFVDSGVSTGVNYAYGIVSFNEVGISQDSSFVNMIICDPIIETSEQISFIKDTISANGNMWWARALGDIDGNGFLDIVFQDDNANGGWLGWLQSNSNGTAWTQQIIANTAPDGGTFASGDMALGDIDNDGDLDVLGFVHTGEWDNPAQATDIYWYENPSWQATYIGRAEDFVKEVELSDLDNDGDLDLVTESFVSNRLEIFRQELPDSWSKVQNIEIENLHEGLDLGDIDGDSYVDIATNGYWIENPGGDLTGLWSVRTIDSKWHDQGDGWQDNATKVYCRDINGDGRVEVFIAHSENSGYPISWYSSEDPINGTWTENVIATCWSFVHSLQVFDIDLDGDYDLIAGENGDRVGENPEFGIFLNEGDNQNWQYQRISNQGSYKALVGDLEGNGTPDIWWMNSHEADELQIYINQTSPPLVLDNWERHVIDAGKPSRSIFITSEDMDGDDKKDIITGGWWYKNPGNPENNWTRNYIGGSINNMVAVYDFDNDSSMDVLGTTGSGASVSSDFRLANNDGTGNFTFDDIIDGEGDFVQGVAIGEYQNNQLGIAMSWHQAGFGIQMLTYTGGSWSWSRIHDNSQDEDLSAADLDDDGDLDLLMGTWWLRNEGNAWTQFTLNPTSGNPDRNELVDINGDGRLDVVIGFEAISQSGKLAWYEKPENPTDVWTEHIISNQEFGPMSLDAADIDFDGDIDIVTGEHNLNNPETAECIIFENVNGGRSWVKHVVYTGDEHHDGTRLVDIEGDGDLDIISIGWGHSNVLLYENLAIDLNIPEAPSNLTGSAIASSDANLSWTDNSDNEDGFIIERQFDNGGYIVLDTVFSNDVTYSDTTVIAGYTYDYRVKSFNEDGESVYSNSITIMIELPTSLPNSPTGLVANQISPSQIGLSWEDNSDNEDLFIVERQINNGGFSQLLITFQNTTSVIDTEVSSGNTYDYRVFARNVLGDSEASDTATITIDLPISTPEAPSDLIAQEISQTEIQLAWQDNSDNEEGFIIERQVETGGFSTIDTVLSNTMQYNDPSVSEGINYAYHVKAFNEVGQSVVSNTDSILIIPTPSAPSGLTATEISQQEVELSWQDNSEFESGFIIERQANDSGYEEIDTIAADIVNYTDPTVGPSINYDYRLKAFNDKGSSTFSNIASLSISGAPSNLVLDLPFNGDADDRSNYSNHGMLNGNVVLTDDRNANPDNAYAFDGANDHIEVAHAPELNLDYITLSAWIYIDTYKDDQRIISKETGSVEPWSSYTLLLSGANERYLQFRIGINGERKIVTSTAQLPLGQWIHVAASYDGSAMKVFIDGVLNNAESFNGLIQDTPNPVYIGQSQFWPRSFDGKIDDIKIYNEAISDSEIADLFSSSSALRLASDLSNERTSEFFEEASLTVNAFPNPISENKSLKLQFNTDVNEGSPVKLYLFDLYGSMILNKEIRSTDAGKSLEIDLSDMLKTQGVYFLRLSNEQGEIDVIKLIYQ